MDLDNIVYLKLIDLPQQARDSFNIKSLQRLDCVSACIPNADMRGLTFFINGKGQLYFYKTKARDICKVDLKRQAVWMLTGKSINLSSIFVELEEYPQFAYGNPPHSKMMGLKRDKPNPLFAFKNDLYLFLINSDYSEIELIILPGQKNLWNTYYFKLIQGEFDELIEKLRTNAEPFFDYGL